MNKIYQVILQDEYDNLYNFGFFKNLKTAIHEINIVIKQYSDFQLKEEDLTLYPSTYGECFDLDLYSLSEDEELMGMMIRGFVLYEDELNLK